MDRAIADDEEADFVKLHVKEGTDRILGATIIARPDQPDADDPMAAAGAG